uniref:V-ATPase_H_C domain-containing protein n=1 Tax=Heterorhabditis bacteriophora TaxID=37862 RepID=A0A1I7X753_HETBA
MSWLSQLLEKNNPDPRVRLELGQLFLNHLTTARLPSDSKTINDYCDLIFQWISASNFKLLVV